MFYSNTLNLIQVGGGTQVKQGDLGSKFSYKLANEKDQELDVFDKEVAHINLVLDDKIVFTTTATVDNSTVTFNIDKAIPVGLYFLEIKIRDYIFPSDRQTVIFVQSGGVAYDLKELVPNYDTNMTIKGILSDLSQKGIDISGLKAQLAEKANKDEVTNVMTPRGNIAYASLPTSGNQVGWYYYCPDGDGTHGAGNYVWNGTSWYFGGTGDEGYNLLKEDLNNLNNGIDNLNNGIETFLSKSIFKRGWLLNGNYKDTSTSKVACMNNITIDRKLELHIADGFKAAFHVFENGVFKYDTGWKTGIFYLSAGAEFKMVVCRVNEDTSELADVTDFVEKVTFSSEINDRIVAIENNIVAIENNIENLKESNINGLPEVYHTKYKTLFSGYRPTAGTTIVGNELWVFQSSRDDFSTYADVKRYSLDDFSEITQGNITHNLGHANTVDYCEETDCLIVGNASLGSETPRFDIITNVSSLMDGNEHQITYGEDNIISYDCSLFGGHYLSCCFGGNKRTAFIVMGGESGTLENPRGIKIQLGMGNTDISNWGTKGGGTFISGKSIDEYNGTFYVIEECVSDIYLGAFQGMCFHNGNLYVASGGNIARIYELQMTTSGKMYVKNSYQIDMYYSSNARINLEPEGLCVYKGMYFIMYVGGMDNQYDSQTLLIPIENKQCGKGNVGERVVLDFKCNHVPNIHITATSNVTDLYISQIDKEGFTVSSSSNGNGTFNWESDIY